MRQESLESVRLLLDSVSVSPPTLDFLAGGGVRRQGP